MVSRGALVDVRKIIVKKIKELRFYLIFVQNLSVYTNTLLTVVLTHTEK